MQVRVRRRVPVNDWHRSARPHRGDWPVQQIGARRGHSRAPWSAQRRASSLAAVASARTSATAKGNRARSGNGSDPRALLTASSISICAVTVLVAGPASSSLPPSRNRARGVGERAGGVVRNGHRRGARGTKSYDVLSDLRRLTGLAQCGQQHVAVVAAYAVPRHEARGPPSHRPPSRQLDHVSAEQGSVVG